MWWRIGDVGGRKLNKTTCKVCGYVFELTKAIDTLKNGLWWDRKRLDEAIDIAIAALCPISRERVEKVWRGKWKYSHTSEIDHFAVVKCSKCGYEAFAISLFVKDGNFCPSCGAPMTDEAVQMVMERLEALKDE